MSGQANTAKSSGTAKGTTSGKSSGTSATDTSGTSATQSASTTDTSGSSTTTGSKTGQATTKTSSYGVSERTPWEAAEGYLQSLYGTGAQALKDTQGKLFGGTFISGPTAAQRQSVQSLLAAAPQLNAGSVPLTEFAMRVAQGEFLDPNNPTLQNAISAVNNPILRNLQEKVLPGVTDAAMAGGAYGGTANALREADAIEGWNTSALENASKMTLDWTNARMQDIFNVPGMFDAANRLALQPGAIQGAAGDYERGLDQLIRDNQLKQYENELAAPWYGIDQYSNLLTAGGFGTTTTKEDGTSVTDYSEESKGQTDYTGKSETEGTSDTQTTGSSDTTESGKYSGKTSGSKSGTTTGNEADELTQWLQAILGGLSTGASISSAGGLSTILSGLFS